MKSEYFLEALNNVNEKYIEEARQKNIKKRFNFKPIIAAAACAVFALAAIPVATHFAGNPGTQQTQAKKIGASGKFTAYESSVHDSDNKLNANHNIEFQINKSYDFFEDSKKTNTEKTIEFGGKTWTGKYQNSIRSPYYSDDHDSYFGEINGEQFVFTIHSKTGEIRSFTSSEMKKENTGISLTHDECYKIAAEFLKTYVDINNYELKSSRYMEWRKGYYFQFHRTLNGIMTSEYISIGVRDNGEIFMYTLHSKGAMDNVDASAISMEVINKVIDAKVQSIYKNNYSITCGEKSIIITKTRNGDYILDCEVAVEGKITEKSEIVKDICYLAVTIDK